MIPPLIGLAGRRKQGRDIVGFTDVLHHLDLDIYFADYGRGVAQAGGIPVNLPVESDVAAVVERLDGVVLTGGTDIDPLQYGAEAHPELLELEPERDELELALYRAARARQLPVLGICRGIQLINVAEGGTLKQHIPEHSRLDLPTEAEIHGVDLTAGSTLASLYGRHHRVNSLHHQTVDVIGPGLTVTAIAEDGVVEGLELGQSVVAVQWHPEMMAGRDDDPVFVWLVERAAAVAAAR